LFLKFYELGFHAIHSAFYSPVAEKEEFEQELENYKAQYKIKVTGLVSQSK